MTLQKIVLKPSVNRENTRYTNEGGYYESNLVRFRQGTPEKIGGWTRISANRFLGVCRSLWNWATLATKNLLGLGTNLKFYIETEGSYYDITPIKTARTLTNPFTTVNGSPIVTVTDGAGGYAVDSFVTFNGGIAVGGLTIFGEYQIKSATLGSYTITASSNATSTVAVPAGGTVYATYQLSASPSTVIPVFGWGAGTWGSGVWGTSGSPATTTAATLTIWNQNNFGQNLIYGPRGGALYYWDATIGYAPTTANLTINSPCVVTSTLNLASNTPITFQTTGALPTGVTPGTIVYTRYITPTTFWLASDTTEVYLTASCSGTTLTVTDVTLGTLALGMTVYYLSGASYVSLGTITVSGGGGAGSYTLSVGGTVTSTEMSASTLIVTTGSQSGTHSISPRGIPISALAGASSTPISQNYFLVSDVSRFVICFGTNEVGSTVIDPMFIRWSDQESVTNWTPAITNQAGSLRLSHGSKIITALQSRQEILIWTDSSLYALQYLGPPYVWGSTLLADNISFIGPNAATIASGVTYWMGVDKFYKYDGRVQTLRCDLLRFIYTDINTAQFEQVFASTNEGFNEIWFFYCTANSYSIDRYVVYNYIEDGWYYGSLSRTAWLDSGLRNYPLAATYDSTAKTGNIVNHEFGVDNGEGATLVPIESSITSAQFDIGDGHNFAFVWRMLPDLTFSGSTAGTTPSLTMQLQPLQNSGSGYNNPKSVGGTSTDASQTVLATQTYPIDLDTYNGQLNIRVRGRQMSIKISCNTLGTQWQLGSPRIDLRPDGRRGS